MASRLIAKRITSIKENRNIKSCKYMGEYGDIKDLSSFSYVKVDGGDIPDEHFIFDLSDLCIDHTKMDGKFLTKIQVESLKNYAETMENVSRSSPSYSIYIVYSDFKEQSRLIYSVSNEYKEFNLTAKERNMINKFLNNAELEYAKSSANDKVRINCEDEGTNYLEKQSNLGEIRYNKDLFSYITNVSFTNLFELYEKMGNSLFKLNVREGLSGSPSKRLRDQFLSYFYISLILVIKDYKFENDEIRELFEDLVNEVISVRSITNEDIEQSKKINFWYKHNGVTLFSTEINSFLDDHFEFSLSSCKTSIINGAQSISGSFYNMVYIEMESFKFLKTKMTERKFKDEEKIDISNLMIEIIKKVTDESKLKLIIVYGNVNLSREITVGLNTQIPVKIENIASISQEVDFINNKMLSSRVQIIRDGESG